MSTEYSLKMEITFTFDIVDYCVGMYAEQTAFANKEHDKWKTITHVEFKEKVYDFAYGLITLGVNSLENVATIFSSNCYEWNIIDMALALTGAVHVPVYPTISDSDYLYILNQTEVSMVFVSDQGLYNKVVRLKDEIPSLKKVFSIKQLPNVDNWELILQLGKDHKDECLSQLETRRRFITVDDTVTIIYTSGTTGFPKGVMLTHRNLVSNMCAAAKMQPIGNGQKVISFLPLCHVYERTGIYQFQYKGTAIYYAENLKSITQNFREIHPHGTTVVPRILEKILKGVMTNATNSHFIKHAFIKWTIKFGFRYKPNARRGFIYKLQHRLADIAVYRHIRTLLGGQLIFVGCGGAHLRKQVERFFWAAGIPVYQGYGLTETSPLVSLNYPGKKHFKLGTTGPILDEVEVKFTNEGEILCKGPNVMKGYYKQDELTNKTIVDGWLHTGDIGKIVKKRYLRIIGRKKQMFKTSYGKYIVPQAIENKFGSSPVIDHIIVIGEGEHCAAAVICPNFQFLKLKLNTATHSNQELIEMSETRRMIQKEISNVNRQLGKTEQLKKFLVVPDEWSVKTGEISATLKIKRNIIQNKYRRQIFDLYKDESIDSF